MVKPGWDRNADQAHLGEVGPLAAQELLHVGPALGRAAAKRINVLLSVRHRSRSLLDSGVCQVRVRWIRAGRESGVGTTTAVAFARNGMEYRTLSSCARIVKHQVARPRPRAHDMVCRTKGSDVSLGCAVRGRFCHEYPSCPPKTPGIRSENRRKPRVVKT